MVISRRNKLKLVLAVFAAALVAHATSASIGLRVAVLTTPGGCIATSR